jgi:hypothetical protein
VVYAGVSQKGIYSRHLAHALSILSGHYSWIKSGNIRDIYEKFLKRQRSAERIKNKREASPCSTFFRENETFVYMPPVLRSIQEISKLQIPTGGFRPAQSDLDSVGILVGIPKEEQSTSDLGVAETLLIRWIQEGYCDAILGKGEFKSLFSENTHLRGFIAHTSKAPSKNLNFNWDELHSKLQETGFSFES